MAFDMASWFKLFTLPPGRCLSALRAVLPVARQYQFDELVAHLERAIPFEEGVLALDCQWRAARVWSPSPSTRASDRVSFARVRDARKQGQEHLLSAVALILSQYMKNDPESSQARKDLLTPIIEQHDIVHAYLRTGRKVRDIDPDTGEITDEIDLEQPEHLEIDPPPASA